MKTQIYRIVMRSLKAHAIYQSEHEPFLPGNIARRGVVGMTSRKAISPLAKWVISFFKSGIDLSIVFSKFLPFICRHFPDISPGWTVRFPFYSEWGICRTGHLSFFRAIE